MRDVRLVPLGKNVDDLGPGEKELTPVAAALASAEREQTKRLVLPELPLRVLGDRHARRAALGIWSIRGYARRGAAMAAVVMSAGTAWASGLEAGTNGSQATARGGAFVAKADDATAIEHNPAGLARLRGFHLSFDSNFVAVNSSFQRAGNYPDVCPPGTTVGCVPAPFRGQPFPKVENGYGLSWVPQIAMAYGFGRVAVAAGIFGPSSPRGVLFPDTVTTANGTQAPSPGRYDLLGSDLFVAFPTLSVAVRPTDWLSVGVSLHYAYSNLKFHQIVATPKTACLSIPAPGDGPDYGGGPESPTCDVDIKIDATDSGTFSATAGLLLVPSPSFELGLSLRVPTDIEADGTAQITAFKDGPTSVLNADNPMDPASKCPGGDAEAARLGMVEGKKCVMGRSRIQTLLPWKVRAGGRYVFRSGERESGDIELDFTYDKWGAFKNIDVQIRGIMPAPEPTIHVPHHYQDTIGVRIGGAKRLELGTRSLDLRAGLSFETAAQGDKYTKLDFAAWQKIGLHTGIGYDLWASDSGSRATLLLGYAFIYMPERVETDSNQAQTNALYNGTPAMPTPANPDPPDKDPRTQLVTIVGNGTFNAAYHVFNAGLGLAF